MTKITASVAMSILVALALTGCGDDDKPTTTPSATPTSESTLKPTPTPTVTPTPVDDVKDVDAALIPPRIGADCDDLISASQRASLLGVPSAEIYAVNYPLANGSAAQLQAGVLTCHWSGPGIDGDAVADISIEILPDAASEFAAFTPPLSGDELLGTLSAGSTIGCYDYGISRICSVHFLVGSHWVDATFVGVTPAGTSDAIATASSFAGLISSALSSSGPLPPAFVPPAGSAPAWSACSVLDSSGGFRAAVSSTSLTAPEPEFSGAGTLFSEAWQRVNFRACTWRHADPYASPAGQIRQASVYILPGGGWAWPSLRASALELGATEVALAGAEEAMMRCFDDDNCTIDALVDGSYVGVTLGMDQYRGGAPALAIVAAEYAIARL